MTTTFPDRCAILSDLWLKHLGNPALAVYFKYADLALPFAYGAISGLITLRQEAAEIIDDAWEKLIQGIGIEDTGFETLDQLLEENPDAFSMEWDSNYWSYTHNLNDEEEVE